jgi:hypothetical protein
MKSLFKSVVLLGVCVTAGLWSSAQEVKNPKPLIDFTEQNFGVRFSHTTNIATTYNPHGGADRVILSYRNKVLGGLLVRPAPPAGSTKEFIEAGKAHYKEKWGALTVDYDAYENPAKYKFHHLKAEAKQSGEDYVLVRYVYLREEDTKQSEDVAEKVIRSMSGAFSFEFVYLKKDHEELKSEIKTVIDTFKIADISVSGTKKGDSSSK